MGHPAESRFLRSARYSLRSGRNDKILKAYRSASVGMTERKPATFAKALSYGAGIAAATAEEGALSSSLELRAVVS